MEIIKVFDEYLNDNGYEKCVLKNTPDLFAVSDSSLLQYCLYNQNYISYLELKTYGDLMKLEDNILLSFDRNKKCNIRKCEHIIWNSEN